MTMPFNLRVVGFEENRPVRAAYNPDGSVHSLEPIEHQHRYFLVFETDKGFQFKAEVSEIDFETLRGTA